MANTCARGIYYITRAFIVRVQSKLLQTRMNDQEPLQERAFLPFYASDASVADFHQFQDLINNAETEPTSET
jgi:hypothetical protein